MGCRRRIAQNFFDRIFNVRINIAAEQFVLIWILMHQIHEVCRGAASGFMTGNREHLEELIDLMLVQIQGLIIDNSTHQGIIRGLAIPFGKLFRDLREPLSRIDIEFGSGFCVCNCVAETFYGITQMLRYPDQFTEGVHG